MKWRWMWRRLLREESEERIEASDRVAKVSILERGQGALLLPLMLPLLLLLLLAQLLRLLAQPVVVVVFY